jgi:glucose/arabinose dehydrogenase
MRQPPLFLPVLAALLVAGCYATRPSEGGGQAAFKPPRTIAVDDVAVPAGYRVELVAQGLTFPTGVAFDDAGTPYVVESGYSYGEVFTTPRLLRVEGDGRTTVVASGRNNGPWTGVAFARGAFYVAEGGQMEGGRILRISPAGETATLIENLPTLGDHHTNGPAIGSDGAIYFGVGAATNSGVVGEDNAQFGWLKRRPDFHDTPCRDIKLTGKTFEGGGKTTGAYAPFGRTVGAVVPGRVPCNGAILRLPAAGGPAELVAWGFRNPFGLAFAPNGRLYVTDNGYDDRGSRPVWGAADHLYEVQQGLWYGWPDFSGDQGLTNTHFTPPGKHGPGFLLAEHPNRPPRPVAIFGVHSSSNGFDFSRSASFGHAGEAFVAQFGDEAPTTGKVMAPVGFKVVRVDTGTGRVEDFLVNRGKQNGPASRIGTHGLERPVAARFNPAGNALYVVDFGVLLQGERGAVPQKGTGALWRVVRGGSR